MVLESDDGRIVGIKIRATETPTIGDFKGLKDLQEAAGSNFVCGIVVYLGDKPLIFGDNLYALPIPIV